MKQQCLVNVFRHCQAKKAILEKQVNSGQRTLKKYPSTMKIKPLTKLSSSDPHTYTYVYLDKELEVHFKVPTINSYSQ